MNSPTLLPEEPLKEENRILRSKLPARITAHPTDAWSRQQARNVLLYAEEQGLKVTHLIRDNDGKFRGGGLDALLNSKLSR